MIAEFMSFDDPEFVDVVPAVDTLLRCEQCGRAAFSSLHGDIEVQPLHLDMINRTRLLLAIERPVIMLMRPSTVCHLQLGSQAPSFVHDEPNRTLM